MECAVPFSGGVVHEGYSIPANSEAASMKTCVFFLNIMDVIESSCPLLSRKSKAEKKLL